MCSQDGGVPLLEQTLKGNTSDSVHFREVLKSLEAKEGGKPEYYVVDAAMYGKETIEVLGDKTEWLSRVPISIKEAQELVAKIEKEALEDIGNGYLAKEFPSTYGGIEHRWFLIFSEEAYEREVKALEKRIGKIDKKLRKELKQLKRVEFSCEADAKKALERIEKKLKYHRIADSEIVEKKRYEKRGKATENTKFEIVFHIFATLEKNELEIEAAKNRKGKFILATNIKEKDDKKFSIADYLRHYKQQQKVERGFRFLKSNEFLADSVFLKKQSRIIALSMVMCLCLMVYTLAERKLRKEIELQGKTLPNQVGKEVKNPTMRWIFQLFEGISVLYKQAEEKIISMVLNIKDIHIRILQLLGEDIAKFYET